MVVRKINKSKMPEQRWSSIDEQMIVNLWNDGYTGYEIARVLKTTRSAILGKISRMRKSGMEFKRDYLPMEERVANAKLRKAPHPNPLSKTKTMKLAYIPKAGEIKPPTPIPTKAPVPINCKPIPFSKLTNKTCKFSVSGNLPADYLFCGAPVHKNCLCEDHYKICYTARGKQNATTKSTDTRNYPSREGIRTHSHRLRA